MTQCNVTSPRSLSEGSPRIVGPSEVTTEFQCFPPPFVGMLYFNGPMLTDAGAIICSQYN